MGRPRTRPQDRQIASYDVPSPSENEGSWDQPCDACREMNPTQLPIEIALTGGPASGKTTTLAVLQQQLSEWGYRPLIAPETATMVFVGAVPDVEHLANHDKERYIQVEEEILLLQMALRERMRALARLFSDERCVIIYDRAEIDVASYVPRDRYDQMLQRAGTTHEQLLASYDSVIHLSSVALADDAEYAKWTNPGRREDREAAIEADARTLAAWMGHEHLHIVDPAGSFEHKQMRVIAALSQALGRPHRATESRRYLIKRGRLPEGALPARARQYEFMQHLTRSSTPQRWSLITRRQTLRPKRNAAQVTYYRQDGLTQNGEQLIRGRIITADEYRRILRSDVTDRQRQSPLIKRRTVMRHRSSELDIDEYLRPGELRPWQIIVSCLSPTAEPDLPEWIGRDVTTTSGYSGIDLALDHLRTGGQLSS